MHDEQPAPDNQDQQIDPQPVTTQPQPVAAPAPVAVKPHHGSSGLVVLQWLTYAFWGWTLLALSSVIAVTFASLISDLETGDFEIYALTALLVLFPIAFICDRFYSAKEPAKQTGASMAVMVIHAVIFALLGVGSLITAVFFIVSILLSSGGHADKIATILSAFIIALLYTAAFLRTLNPARFNWFARRYRWIMLVTSVIALIAVIAGPVAKNFARKDDALIVNNLSQVTDAVEYFTDSKNRLPDSLNELDLKDDAKIMVDKGLVRYKPEGGDYDPGTSSGSMISYGTSRSHKYFKYQLCVTYRYKAQGSAPNYYYDNYPREEYNSYVSTYNHPAGEVCYKLRT
ncbi:MAG: hypothetical protein WAQ57_04365 [Candidatus Saccharimonadales bacterium]